MLAGRRQTLLLREAGAPGVPTGSGLGGEGPGLRPREHQVVPFTIVAPPFREDSDWSRGQGVLLVVWCQEEGCETFWKHRSHVTSPPPISNAGDPHGSPVTAPSPSSNAGDPHRFHVIAPLLLLLLLSHFSRVRLCATPETAAHPAPLSPRLSRQEHWSGLPFPSPMHKSESEVAQSCPTPSDPMDHSPPGSSVHGIFQAGVLGWGAIAFSEQPRP